jgi:4-amino-4-deoxy-L-arabinose transferase-like glycosyltransferase
VANLRHMSFSNQAQVAVHDLADVGIDAVWKAQSKSLRLDPAGEKHEWALVGLILFLFLLLNLLTADRYPFPFFDEVLYADPAVNYVTGHGFTATVPGENAPAFYSYNGPLHSSLLIPWLKVFGISMQSVRSINFVYMAITVLLIWSVAKRLGLVRSTGWRLLLVSMLICDYSIIFSYRCGRYDCLGMLIVALAFWSFSLKSAPMRLTALTLAGAVSPWIGLQLLPLEAVLGGSLLAFTLFFYWREVSAFAAGTVAGALGLIGFFSSHGVLRYFLQFPVVNHVDIDHVLHSQSKGYGFVAGLLQGEFRHSHMLPKDFSLPLVLASAALLAVVLYRRHNLEFRSLLIYGLIFVPLFSLTLILLAKFPTYYGWMTYAPLAICICGSLHLDLPQNVRLFAVGLCVAASIVGVGLHALAFARDWSDRDYAKVQQFVTSNIRPDDWAYVNPQAYYPAKRTAAATFFSNAAGMPSDQKSRVTVCVIEPERVWVLKELGGSWYATGQEMIPAHTGLFGRNNEWGFLSLPNYRLSVYRRVPTT